MRTFVVRAAAATGLTLACIAGVPPVLAAPSSVVTDDPSAHPWTLSILGKTASDVVLSRSYGGSDWTLQGTTVKAPLSGGAAAEIALEPGASVQAVAGNDVLYSLPPFGEQRWADLTTGTTGDVVAQIQFPATYGPHGAAWVADAGGGALHLYTLDVTAAADTAPTDLGVLPPAVTSLNQTYVIDDGSGLVVVSVGDGVAVQHTDAGYQTPVTLPAIAGLSCTAATSNAIGCTAPQTVVRVPLDGSAAQVTKVIGTVFNVAVTPTSTAWYAGTTPALQSRPATGGAVDTSAWTPQVTYGTFGLTSDGSDFIGLLGSTVTEAGLYRFADASATPSLVTLAGPAPSHAEQVTVTAGRVAWSDDSTLATGVRSRPVDSGLQLGSTTDLGSGGAPDERLLVSGPWTLWTTTDRPDPSGPSITTLHVSGATWTDTIGSTTYAAVVALSGNRVLYSRLTSSGARQLVLFDLGAFTSSVLTLTGADLDFGAALWGDYVAYAKADGSVWRRSLASGTTTAVAPAGSVGEQGIKEWGDEVAWDAGYSSDLNGSIWHWRNVTDALSTDSTGALLALTSSGALVKMDPTNQGLDGAVGLQAYDAATPVQVIDDARYDHVSADADVLGWIDWSDQKAHLAALPHVPDQPRSLGAPVAPVLPQGDDWMLSLAASAPLTTCDVTISQGSTVVDTLDCDPALMREGVVAASWPLFPNGFQVPVGQYTWTVDAGNADGPLLASDGSTAPITGIVYSPSQVNVTTLLHDTTVNAGQTVKLHATASSIPSPHVIWQVERRGNFTFSTIAGATSSTLSFTARPYEDGSIYQAIFDNGWTAASTYMHLTVHFAPRITTQPKSVTVAAGHRATFTAAATANPAATVHWQRSTDGGRTWQFITGATSTTLRVTARRAMNGNRYRAVFHNVVGRTRTPAATLHVTT